MIRKKIIALFLTILVCLPLFAVSPSVEAKKIAENEKVALQVAEEGIVLLKNEHQCIPFSSDTKIGIYGKGRRSGYVAGGNGSGWVNTDVIINPFQGINNAIHKDKKFESVKILASPSEEGLDKVIYVIARGSSEGGDRTPTAGDYYLSDDEKNDISSLMKIYPKDLVVVLNVAGIIDTTWLLKQNVPSIMVLWLGGAMGGTALANVLSGDVSPSGKLADTWASDYNDYLSSAYFSDPLFVNYYEDIFVGYRQFETFDPQYKKVNFEFGFGLSYTDFHITTNSVSVNNGIVNVSVDVKNIGNTYSGKEVVQVYYSAPDKIYGNPGKELAGFAKTSILAPGESETLDISFSVNDMASYDDTGKVKKSAWVLEKGEYKFYVGNSIKNAGKNGVAGTYSVEENVIVEECSTFGSNIDKRLLSNGTFETFIKENKPQIKETKINPYGVTRVSALDFSDISDTACIESHYDGMVEHKTLGYLTEAGTFITYTLDVEKEGEYNIAFSLANDVDKSDFCDIYINGKKTDINLSISGNGWYQFRLTSSTKINLPKGKTELKIVGKGMVNLSHFYVYNQNVSPDGKTTLGAEFGTVVSSSNSDCITDGLLSIKEKNSKALYNFYAESAGEYYISIIYSNTGNPVKDALNIKVNGSNLSDGFDMIQTGYSTLLADKDQLLKYVESNALPITLKEGRNSIQISATDNAKNIGYIDSIIIDKKDNNVVFEDNSNSFQSFNLKGETYDHTIKFKDVYKSFADADKDNDLLDEFISQLSILDMASMAGIYPQLNNSNTGTGGYGSVNAPQASGKYGLYPVSTADGPAGIRSINDEPFTYMPCVTMLASTWNTSLAFEFGKAIGMEGFEAGVEVWLAPGANIHRNLLCGRNFEYFSEDPYLTGIMAAQVINGCQSQGVACSIKHFAANSKEYNRTNSDSILSERALREIYLKPFEMAVKLSAPITIMTSYNLINGVETAHDSALLKEIARKEWGFEGVFISDWSNNINHTLSMLGGNNIMSDNPDEKSVVKAFCGGNITREQLEENTKYIILSMLKMSEGGIINNSISSTGESFSADKFSFKTGSLKTTSGALILDKSNDLYYSVVIEKSGDYGMEFQIDSEKEFSFDVYVDGEKYISSSAKSASKDQELSFGKEKTVYLSQGIHNILISINSGDISLSEISIMPVNALIETSNLTDNGFSSVKESVYASEPKSINDEDEETSSEESSEASNEQNTSNESQSQQSEKDDNGFVIYIVIFAVVILVTVIVVAIIKKKKN